MELVLALFFQAEGKTEENETNKRRRKGLFGVFEQVGVQWCPNVSRWAPELRKQWELRGQALAFGAWHGKNLSFEILNFLWRALKHS